MINEEVFRSYDIRGVYNDQLDNELAYNVGRAVGSICNNTVIVGHDARESSNALNKNLIFGLLNSGANVIDIGLVTTPILYYAREFLNIKDAIMITASHCAREYNGFKICDNEGCIYEEKIQNLLTIIKEKKYKNGMGKLKTYNILNNYKKMLHDKIILGKRKIKVVIDCGNGTTCLYNPDIIKEFGVDVIPLYCNLDPSFPNHIPDPAVEDNMLQLQKKVKEENANLGIAFDGDGDRLGIVDENGNLVKTDMFMLIIWKSIYKTCNNKTASFDVKCSLALKESLEKLGLKTKYNRTGHSFLKKAIKENNYDFAGEFSGHVCFNDEFYGYDDALYAALRLLRIITNNNLNISDYFKDVPKYFSSKEDYIKTGENKKQFIVDKIYNYAKSKNYNINDIDGVRVDFENGFALVRKSNTSPCITVRFEGKTKEIEKNIENEFMTLINEELD